MKRFRTVCICALMTGSAVFAVGGFGQEKPESAASHMIVRSADLKWTAVMKGCDMTQVSGDPDADGSQFVLRIRCTDGTKIPAHWHPTDENVTVMKGTFLIGQGEKFDEAKLATMKVGDFVSMPKEMRHFAMSKGESIVQVHGTGPFKSTGSIRRKLFLRTRQRDQQRSQNRNSRSESRGPAAFAPILSSNRDSVCVLN